MNAQDEKDFLAQTFVRNMTLVENDGRSDSPGPTGPEDKEDIQAWNAYQEHPLIMGCTYLIKLAITSGKDKILIEAVKDGGFINLQAAGASEDLDSLPNHVFSKIVARYKEMASLKVGEHTRAQAGLIGLRYEGRNYDIIVRSRPIPDGEKLSIRIVAD